MSRNSPSTPEGVPLHGPRVHTLANGDTWWWTVRHVISKSSVRDLMLRYNGAVRPPANEGQK